MDLDSPKPTGSPISRAARISVMKKCEQSQSGRTERRSRHGDTVVPNRRVTSPLAMRVRGIWRVFLFFHLNDPMMSLFLDILDILESLHNGISDL
jgi:hypothetical protein